MMNTILDNNNFGRHTARIVCLTLLLILVAENSHAQLVLSPIKRELNKKTSRSASTARKQSNHTLTLPFWDDFSFTSVHFNERDTLAGYPLDSLWADSYHVWIKSGIEIDAPSVNVATLDGIDSAGLAYNTDPLANGLRDSLKSQPIDLSIAEVALAERSSVYLSFFYQWRGNGESPDKLDNLRVEFLNVDKEWILVATIANSGEFERDKFYDTLIQVNGEEFFHDKFQFRFKSYGRQSGPFDTWNIDYVYLDKGRDANDNSYDDGALASPAGPLFGPYFSVPYKHFLNTSIMGDVAFDVLNLRTNQTNPDPYTYRTTGIFTNYTGGAATQSTVLLTTADRPVRPGNPLLGPLERYTIQTLPEDRPNPGDPIQFDPAADSIDLELKFLLLSNDNGYYQSNDTISSKYTLNDYYAYDDGTAEYTVSVNDNDDQVAYRFDMTGNTEPDQLVAFDIHIPVFNISGFITGDFFVMDAENGMPKSIVSSISSIIQKTARDKFQRVYLSKPVNVQGTFFIGWKGSFTSVLYIGIDTDTNTGNLIYVNPSGIWSQNTSVEGSLMIRPVFGQAGPITGIVEKEHTFEVYPNPSKGSFYVTGNPEEVQIINAAGQQIQFTKETQEDRIHLTLSGNQTGLFILKLRRGSSIETTKVLVW
jgi:hypothetical protein